MTHREFHVVSENAWNQPNARLGASKILEIAFNQIRCVVPRPRNAYLVPMNGLVVWWWTLNLHRNGIFRLVPRRTERLRLRSSRRGRWSRQSRGVRRGEGSRGARGVDTICWVTLTGKFDDLEQTRLAPQGFNPIDYFFYKLSIKTWSDIKFYSKTCYSKTYVLQTFNSQTFYKRVTLDKICGRGRNRSSDSIAKTPEIKPQLYRKIKFSLSKLISTHLHVRH